MYIPCGNPEKLIENSFLILFAYPDAIVSHRDH